MKTFFEFFTLADPNLRYVVLGILLLSTSAAVVGTFALLKKKALLGDATAHAVLPGICIAFMITGVKNAFYLALGAFATGWLALILMELLTHHSKIKQDTAIALLLSVSFGIGILLLSMIQNTDNAGQLGLNNYLFGKAAALMSDDLWMLALLSILILTVVGLFFKEFTVIAFDKNFAIASKLPVNLLEFIFTSLIVLAIIIGIQAVGIVLMAAMLITPAAAARFWTDRLITMLCLAALFGAIAGIVGSYISYIAPGMPTGPWVVIIATIIAYLSFLFAPTKGIIAKWLRQRKHQQKILIENILKLFYEVGEAKGDLFTQLSKETIQQYRPLDPNKLRKGLFILEKNSLLYGKDNTWRLTGAGKNEGKRITQQHRLWENYLAKYLKSNPTEIHQNAELVEHVLTPELVKELNKIV